MGQRSRAARIASAVTSVSPLAGSAASSSASNQRASQVDPPTSDTLGGTGRRALGELIEAGRARLVGSPATRRRAERLLDRSETGAGAGDRLSAAAPPASPPR